MKLNIMAAALVVSSLAFAASAADTSAAARSAMRSASQPVGSGSPAVQASENAEMPGDLRPEKRAVPQISIPLKRRGADSTAAAASTAAGKNGIDDDAARCSAKKTPRERADCRRPVSPKEQTAIKR